MSQLNIDKLDSNRENSIEVRYNRPNTLAGVDEVSTTAEKAERKAAKKVAKKIAQTAAKKIAKQSAKKEKPDERIVCDDCEDTLDIDSALYNWRGLGPYCSACVESNIELAGLKWETFG